MRLPWWLASSILSMQRLKFHPICMAIEIKKTNEQVYQILEYVTPNFDKKKEKIIASSS